MEAQHKNKKNSTRKSGAKAPKHRRYELQRRLERNKLARVMEHNGPEAAVAYAVACASKDGDIAFAKQLLRSMKTRKPGAYRRAMAESEEFRRAVA